MKEDYIKRKYGITLVEREEIMKAEDYKCPGCGRDLRECRPEVDHEHVTNKMIIVVKVPGGWAGQVILQGGHIIAGIGKTKEQMIKNVKENAKRPSVRGVLCGGRYAGCNRKLGRLDNIPWLRNAVAYLSDPPARKVLK